MDYMITRQTDADYGKVRVDYRVPVGFSGFRDHRPPVARVCTRARWKQKQLEEEKPKRWDRTLVEREYKLLLNWESAAQKRQDAPSTEEPMFLRIRREINRVVHSSLSKPDIEAEIVKRALDTCCTALQRKARTLRLPGEVLALVEQKQRFIPRWRGAFRLSQKEQLSRPYKSQTAVVKGAVRAYKRKKLEELAGEVEQAGSRGEARATYAMVKRLAPFQVPPRVTVRQKDGSPTWERAEMHWSLAEPLSLETEPQLHQPKTYLLGRLLNTKLKMRSGQLHSCQVERLVRAFEVEALQMKTSLEERLQSSGKQWLDSLRRLHYRHVRRPSLQPGERLRPQAVFRKKIKMPSLHSHANQAKALEMRKLENHRVAQPHWQGLGKSISSSTCASSCRGCAQIGPV